MLKETNKNIRLGAVYTMIIDQWSHCRIGTLNPNKIRNTRQFVNYTMRHMNASLMEFYSLLIRVSYFKLVCSRTINFLGKSTLRILFILNDSITPYDHNHIVNNDKNCVEERNTLTQPKNQNIYTIWCWTLASKNKSTILWKKIQFFIEYITCLGAITTNSQFF